MDPALWEVLESGDRLGVVSVLVRLQPGAAIPEGLRAVTRFGDVITARLPRGDVVAMRLHPSVASLKAARELRPSPVGIRASRPTGNRTERNPWWRSGAGPTGRGVVVGVLDWGVDFTHPNFCTRDGHTRLLAIWDQRRRRHTAPLRPYGYGRLFASARIDAALRADDPFAALGYDPADADADATGTHGTHVLDIAAGTPRVGRGGVAPAAELVFVHLASERSGPRSIGNSVNLLEGIDFVSAVAGNRPCVVNLSLGSHAGPHDGTTLVEQALDAFVTSRPGRTIVQSVGNYRRDPIHASGRLDSTTRGAVDWLIAAGDCTTNEFDLWYPGCDRLAISLLDADGHIVARATPDSHGPIVHEGEVIGRFAHRTNDPNNGDNQVALVLDPTGDVEAWRVVVDPLYVASSGACWHAWIERDEAGRASQSRLRTRDAVATTTTGTIANGHHTIVVGALDQRTGRVAAFSSVGPTRDGRSKPDVIAPGVGIVAARSSPLDDDDDTLLTSKSGTSMAAPHVTGAVALVHEAAGRALDNAEVRGVLGIEAGRSATLDLAAAVESATRLLPAATGGADADLDLRRGASGPESSPSELGR